jgi:hypothetical protein
VENRPIDAEPIAHLANSGDKELLSNRHQDLTAVGKGGENAFGLTVTIHSQRQVRTPHRLGIWNVRCPDFRVTNRNARMQHCVLPLRADAAWTRRLSVSHHRANFCPEMLLVVAKRFNAFAREIHVRIHVHL